MNAGELRHLKFLYKALGDDNRLRMVGYLSRDERKVTELAKLLGIREATVSHHISKLREVGLLNLRVDGNQHFYRINPRGLETLKRLTADIEAMPLAVDKSQPDMAWIDALEGFDENERKVLRDYAPEGYLRQIPRKQIKLLAVLNWISRAFEADRFYTEPEVNGLIQQYHNDYATLRRELVDFGYLRRERGGGRYWVTPEGEGEMVE